MTNTAIDWPRVRHLMKLGICGAMMTLVGDMLLGWGVHDPAASGIEGFLSAYLNLPDDRIFFSSFLGFIGITLEALCCFSVYRVIKPYSEKHAHLYRAGILGVLAFAACGVHVPCLAAVYVYKHMMAADPASALDVCVRFGLYFLMPGMVAFFIFWIVQHIAHISAFSKGLTPYPRWCWVFCPAVGMAATMLAKLLPETCLRNAVTAAWISFGNLWMFIGLLAMSRRAEIETRASKLL